MGAKSTYYNVPACQPRLCDVQCTLPIPREDLRGAIYSRLCLFIITLSSPRKHQSPPALSTRLYLIASFHATALLLFDCATGTDGKAQLRFWVRRSPSPDISITTRSMGGRDRDFLAIQVPTVLDFLKHNLGQLEEAGLCANVT